MAQGSNTPDSALPAYVPLNAYENLDLFFGRLGNQGSKKTPSLLALQSLCYSRPKLARQIFERAVMEPFNRHLAGEFIHTKLSDEGTRRIDELRERFLQEPIFVLGMLEAIFVIERIEPWAKDTVKLMGGKHLTLEQVRRGNFAFAQDVESNGYALASVELHTYTRERDYRIMLELVSQIDGRSVEEQALRIFADLPVLQGLWAEYGDGATRSLIGTDGAKRIVMWVFGYCEF